MTPKFLTKDLAALAVITVLKSIMDEAEQFGIVKKACHICVAVPSVERHLSHHKNISMEMLYEFSYNKALWTAEYAKIANSKALQLWEDRNDGRTDIMPPWRYRLLRRSKASRHCGHLLGFSPLD